MNNKVVLGIVAVVVVILGIAVFTLGNGNSSSSNAAGSGDITLSTNPNPPHIGQTTFMVSVKDKNGKPVDNAKVNFTINMTSMNMGSQQGSATSQGNGNYSAAGRFSMGGPWRVSTQITMPDGGSMNKDFDLNVQ